MPTIGRIASGKSEERDQCQEPVLIEHDPDQEDDGQRILADRTEDIRRGAAQQHGVAGEARDQGPARMRVKIGEIGTHQSREQRFLHIGDDALADAVHQHRLAVIGETLDDGDSQSAAGDQQQQRAVTPDKDAVENRLHQPRAQRRAAGRQPHQQERECDPWQMRAHEIARQAPYQRGSARALLKDRRLSEHGSPPAVLKAGTALGKGGGIRQRLVRRAAASRPYAG